MTKKLYIPVIIPARGGSKGIPHKNIIPLAGKPLIAWTILSAINARNIGDVFVTTDDDDIAKISLSYGAQIIRRPSELSNDTASSESALIHALETIAKTKMVEPDFVVFLQATSPLREPSDIETALTQIISDKGDSLLSAYPIRDHFIWERSGDNDYISITYDYKNRQRRQNIQERYLENGSIYIFKPYILQKHHNRLGGKITIYEMPRWKSYQIDSAEDIEICEYYIKTRIMKCYL